MTDIFFSYSSQDRDAVRLVHDALKARGFSIFWDQAVPAGVDWDTWIRTNLAESKCAIVFWSRKSVASDNVRHEATVAKDHGKLIPVMLDNLTSSEFPMGLWSVQGANLTGYDGTRESSELQKLFKEVEARLTPVWARQSMDSLEAQLVAERARRETAERRDQLLQDQIATEAAGQQTLKRERDVAVGEVTALKAQITELQRARADVGNEAAKAAQLKTEIEVLKKTFEDQKQEADTAEKKLTVIIREIEAENEGLKTELETARSKKSRPVMAAATPTGSQPIQHGYSPRQQIINILIAMVVTIAALPIVFGIFFGTPTDLNATVEDLQANAFYLEHLLIYTLPAAFLGTVIGLTVYYGLAVLLRQSGWVAMTSDVLVRATLLFPIPALLAAGIYTGPGPINIYVLAALATMHILAAFVLCGANAFSLNSLRVISIYVAIPWTIVAETYFTQNGIGHQFYSAFSLLETPRVLAVVAMIVFTVTVLEVLFAVVSSFLSKQTDEDGKTQKPWLKKASGEQNPAS